MKKKPAIIRALQKQALHVTGTMSEKTSATFSKANSSLKKLDQKFAITTAFKEPRLLPRLLLRICLIELQLACL